MYKYDVRTLYVSQKTVCSSILHLLSVIQDEVAGIKKAMAEFEARLMSYDNAIEEAKRLVGDATHEVSNFDVKLQVLRRNITSLKGSLGGVQMNHKDTVSNLELLTTVS